MNKEPEHTICVALGHPLVYIDVTTSGKVGETVGRCRCGAVDEAPEALKEWQRKKRAERKARLVVRGIGKDK